MCVLLFLVKALVCSKIVAQFVFLPLLFVVDLEQWWTFYQKNLT